MQKKIRFIAESTFAQQCYEQLQSEIINGVFNPGEKLKVEHIKTRFGIGQSPVREALCRLAAFGLVTIENNKGFRVAAVSQADVRDIYKTFTAIENMALALAIKHGDATWEANIVAELYKLSLIENQNIHDHYAVWAERNYNFHVALIAGCNSPVLLDIRYHLYLKFDRYCQLAYNLTKNKLATNHAGHEQLAQAVLAKDLKTAQALMTHHINGALEDVISVMREQELI